MPHWTPPQEFDGYRLIRRIGSGRMGHVYLAEDTLLHRPVAVKFLANDPGPEDRERLLVEARAIARLQHPNVVAIYRVGEASGRPYLTSEFVRGEPLDKVQKPVAAERLLRVAVGLARGLAAAHRHGVLHRDIKPANAILSEDGEAKLLDFGLAKLVDDTAAPPRVAALSPPAPPALPPAPPRDPLMETTRPPGHPAEAAAELRVFAGTPMRVNVPPSSLDVAAGAQDQTVSFIGEALAARAAPPAVAPLPHEPEQVEGMAALSLTRPGQVLGTPLYMAPEAWRGEPANFRSDVYSLGALIYELACGHPPHERPNLLSLREAALDEDVRPLVERAAVDPRLAQVVDRCLARDGAARYATGEELREALEQLLPGSHAAAIPEGNPYRGLSAFEAEHRPLFFGRDADTRAVLERLSTGGFVLVAGDSGVGKSSVCRAAVLPAVREGALEQGRRWTVATFVPGRHPLHALVAALAPLLGTDEEALTQRMVGHESTLGRELRRHQGQGGGVLLFCDQLEELVTLSEPEEARQVAETLGWLAQPGPGLAMLATVRGDFLTRVAALSGLGEEVARALYILRPLSRENVRDAVVGPARAKGVSFESEALVSQLVDSAALGGGGLPLLQFALAELWDQRDTSRRVIPQAALEKIGGVAGALARHADGVLDGLLHHQRQAAQRLLLQLVTPEGTRARRTEPELVEDAPAARAALDALVRGRLLVAREAADGSGFEVAHEALLAGWPTLRKWREDDAEDRILRERLESAASEWDRLGRADEGLWAARQLAEVDGLEASQISSRAGAFLGASRRMARKRRWTLRLAAAAVPVLLAGAYGTVQVKNARDLDARVAARLADAREHLQRAEKESADLERARTTAFAAFDGKDTGAGEAAWSRALELDAQLDGEYGDAAQALEAALALDPARDKVRGMLGDVLVSRALLAERDRRNAQRDEYVRRIALYDPDGSRQARWRAPGRVSLVTEPPGAQVLIERYVPQPDGRLVPQKYAELGPTPAVTDDVPTGSYRATLTLPGRALVRAPFVVERGKKVDLSVELPRAEAIPPGFVYVPAGTFLFGTAADEGLRKSFFAHAPIHPVHTDAYLIAQHETTFAEWLDFLDSISDTERAQHLPRETVNGNIALDRTGGRWRLTLRPTSYTYSVEAGERVHYLHRKVRAVQDWLRFPALGLSADDAIAYVQWLDHTGKVPGARLCTEVEWERAARGADGRELPEGDNLNPDDANIDVTYGKDPLAMGPDEVGSHPGSRSPFDVDDLAGNVWEWTSSSLVSGEVLLRGGSFFHDQSSARAVNRQVVARNLRDLLQGLRVCASLPPR